MIWSRLSVAISALFVLVELCAGQDLEKTWLDGQKNVTWCQWESPRAAIIRDTLYIDGGALRVYPGMSDGSYGELIEDGNPRGVVYMLNFSTPFEMGANFSGVFTNFTKAGFGFANNIAPNFLDGAMLANNYEWFTYGGLISATDTSTPPEKDWTAKYMAYRSGPARPFEASWQKEELGENVTRYVSNGASVSIPSEDLGFYFGGLRGADFGAIDDLAGNASTPSLTMIEVNMATQNQETWKNRTLPADVISRANGELAWVPVSEKGILIAVGGVITPSFATETKLLNDSEILESKRVSPGFMSSVAVYDIDKAVWYEQKTSGSIPTQLTQGCTVVASAQDGSSHNIYWYGGYDGIRLTASDSFVDDVWALSVPSFIWTKVKSGDVKHARAGHKCVKPYPDQMIIVGGRGAPTGTTPKCLDKGVVQIFNLSSATWVDSYDPLKWSEYSVPSSIYDNIGGSGQGGATVTEPKGGFDNSSLAAVFKAKYDGSKIIKYYPFSRVENKPATPSATVSSVPLPSGTPSYLAPVLGVVLGLFFITLIVLAVLLFRRRKLLRNQTVTQSEAGTIENRRWIDNWLVGQPPIQDKDSPTTTTDETPMTAYEEERQEYVPLSVPEIGGGQVFEIEDTSRPVELHAQTSENPTGLIPIQGGGLRPSHSVASHASATSTVSHISDNSNRPAISPVTSDFSPATPHGPNDDTDHQRRIVSDMSGITEMDRGHLRGISETSVSTIGQYATPMDGLGSPGSGHRSPHTPGSPFGPDSYSEIRERERSATREEAMGTSDGIIRQDGGRPSLVSPLSPPGGLGEGEDYLSARDAGSPAPTAEGAQVSPTAAQRRKSNFQEVLD